MKLFNPCGKKCHKEWNTTFLNQKNGYESVHLTIDPNESNFKSPYMEIQIRTAYMDAKVVSMDASHGLYKGELTYTKLVLSSNPYLTIHEKHEPLWFLLMFFVFMKSINY